MNAAHRFAVAVKVQDDAHGAQAARVRQAALELAAGRLVVFPTETVYGLGGDAASARAVQAIYTLKGRPADHPLIVHVADLDEARKWGAFPDGALQLAHAFWPGPLTLIVQRQPHAAAWAGGGQTTIGLRVPAHPLAQALLRAFGEYGGSGVAAPSANRFGRVSPTRAEHVRDDLGDEMPFLLDGGPCEVGVESTIIDYSRGRPVLLRPGGVSAPELERVLHAAALAADAQAPRASGTLAAHYAPRTPMELLSADQIHARAPALAADGMTLAVWSRADPRVAGITWLPMSTEARLVEHDLYDTLRKLDAKPHQRLLVEAPPSSPQWDAVADRLRRAATGAAPRDDT